MAQSKTQRTCTEEEYHSNSSDRCPACGELFYIMDTDLDKSIGYECPWCDDLMYCEMVRRLRADIKRLKGETQ